MRRRGDEAVQGLHDHILEAVDEVLLLRRHEGGGFDRYRNALGAEVPRDDHGDGEVAISLTACMTACRRT